MTEKFEKYMETLLKTDPLILEIPPYANKEKVKSLSIKHQEEQASYNSSRTLPTIATLSILAENLKKVSVKFQEEYNSIKKLKESNAELTKIEEKHSKASDAAKSIEEGLNSKYKSMINSLVEEQNGKQKEIDGYVDQRQAELSKEQQIYQELCIKQAELTKQKEFLLENKEKVFKEVDSVTQQKNEEIVTKKKNLEELVQKLNENVTSFTLDKELENDQPNPEIIAAEEFTNKYATECEEILKLWEQNSSASNLTDKSLTGINKNIEKIQKQKFVIESDLKSLKDKLFTNANNLNQMFAENMNLRNKIAAEQNKQQTFTKLYGDLQAKLKP